jgi:hypothetical protein
MMPQEFKTEVVDGILRATGFGTFGINNAQDFFRQVMEEARVRDVRKILIDARPVTGDIPAMARFDIGKFISQQCPVGIKIVFVVSMDKVWADRFFENVVVTRGIDAKVVTDIEEGLELLKDDPANKPAARDRS